MVDETTEEVRNLAERWAKRWRFDAGEPDDDDCDACDGEAVPSEAIVDHECSETLPPCPACGPYQGRKPPPEPLTDDEQTRLFARVRAEMDRAASEDMSYEPVEEVVAVAVIELLGSDESWVGHLIDAVDAEEVAQGDGR